MTEAQVELTSGILANLGIGLILTGALGPSIVQAPLRFGLQVVIGCSSVSGLAFILLAIYMRRK